MAKPSTTTAIQEQDEAISAALNLIHERIELLRTVQTAFRFAMGLPVDASRLRQEPGAEVPEAYEVAEPPRRQHRKQPQPSKFHPPNRAKRGTNRDLLLSVLDKAKEPLSINEIYTRMLAKGWKSGAQHPKSLLRPALFHLITRGVVRRVGADFELAAAPPATVEETTTTTETQQV